MDFHRSPADTLHLCVDAKHIAHLDGPDEGHGVDRNRHHPALGALDPCNAARLIHPRKHPAAEDIAVRIGVGGHGNGAHGKVSARLSTRLKRFVEHSYFSHRGRK